MAFIPTPDAARVVINWAKGAETFSYTFYCTKPGFDFAEQQALASAINGVHNATVKGYFAPGITYVNTTVYDARVSDGAIVTNGSNTGNGTATGEPHPINVAMVVTMRTPGRGRSARGRKFITGFNEAAIVNGEYNASTQTMALAYVNALWNAMGTAGWQLVIRSIQQDKQVINPANTRGVTSIVVRNLKVATQRRRVDRA